MDNINEIFDRQRLPGYNKKNRKIIYDLIFSIFQIIFQDTKKVIKAFFPALADNDSLLIHAKALDIFIFPFDSETTIREKISKAAFFKEEIGQRKTIIDFLNIYVPDRYQLSEYTKDSFRIRYSKIGYARFGKNTKLVVKVNNMTSEEESNIMLYLHNTLDPDIEIYVIEENI